MIDYGIFFLSLRPGASSGVPMNSIPASSKARFIPINVDNLEVGSPSSCSIRFIVLEASPVFTAKSSEVHLSNDLAALICPLVIN